MVLDKSLSSLNEWMSGRPTPPSILGIELGDGCNQRCVFCPHGWKSIKKSSLISERRLLSLIDEAVELGAHRLFLISSGEPLYNLKKASNIMMHAKQKNLHCVINTNGTLFTEELIRNLVMIGWNNIIFSIEAAKPDIHDKLVSLKGAFNKATNNIKTFNKWKNKLKKQNPEIVILTVVNKENYLYLSDMVRLAKKLNTGLRFDNLQIFTKRILSLAVPKIKEKELSEELYKSQKLAKKLKLKNFTISEDLVSGISYKPSRKDYMRISKFLLIKKSNKNKLEKKENPLFSAPCYKPWIQFVIFPQGNVSHCFFYHSLKSNVKEKSIKEIWFSKEFDNIRNKILHKKLLPRCGICGDIDETIKLRKELLTIS